MSKAITIPIVFDKFELTIDSNQFYRIIVNDSEFGVYDLQLLVNTQKEIGGYCLPVLVICHEFAGTNVELLQKLSKNENNPYSLADAFVINSMAQRLLANFYIRISKPERPTRFFNTEEEAKEWLQQFK